MCFHKIKLSFRPLGGIHARRQIKFLWEINGFSCFNSVNAFHYGTFMHNFHRPPLCVSYRHDTKFLQKKTSFFLLRRMLFNEPGGRDFYIKYKNKFLPRVLRGIIKSKFAVSFWLQFLYSFRVRLLLEQNLGNGWWWDIRTFFFPFGIG